MKNKIGFLVVGSAMLGSLFISSVALAQGPQTPPPGAWAGRGGPTAGRMPGVFGTVSAVNGSTITLTSRGFGSKAATTTYSIDASNATVMKDNATSSVSAISAGDALMVQGTVSGTSVSATIIRDLPVGNAGGMPMMRGGMGMGQNPHTSTSTPKTALIQGNGEPVIGGAVTAISGSTLTVTNKSNLTYTVDISSAVIEKGNASSTISAISIGDNVVVQGTVNGTSVTASSVIDQNTPPAGSGPKGFVGSVIGAVGGFFKHIFGFF